MGQLFEEEKVNRICYVKNLDSHLQSVVECMPVMSGAKSSLEAVHDEDNSDVFVGELGVAQLP